MSICKSGVMQSLNNKIVDPCFKSSRAGISMKGAILAQIFHKFLLGAEPKLLAFSTAVGITVGIFPICGVTVFLCGLAIALLGHRCHAPSVMLANFIATPIELSLMIPFLRLGEFICGGPRFPLTSDAMKKVVTGHASREVLLSIVHALLGWIIAAPLILVALYTILLPAFKYLVRKFSTVPPNPKDFSPRTEIKTKVRDA